MTRKLLLSRSEKDNAGVPFDEGIKVFTSLPPFSKDLDFDPQDFR